MPKYAYTAIDMANKKVSGVAEARDDADFRRIMRSRSLVPVKYRTVEEKLKTYRLKSNESADFARQLASMLGSGITVVRAMEILKDRDFKPKLKQVYEKLHRDVQQGFTVSEAMKMQPRAFPELLVNMFASGEASGQLEHVAKKMADHYDKDHRLNGKVKSAMTYPMILLVVTTIVVLVIFTLVLPSFFVMFEDMDTELPALTQVVIGISQFLTSYWYVVIIVLLLVAAAFQYIRRIRKVAVQLDKLKLRAPIVGKLMKIIYTARFARTLSSLYSSGVSMLRALEITATILANKFIEDQFGEVVRNVRNGDPLSAAVGKVDGFDKKLATSILIGEESGRLDTMLVSTAESFDYEAEIATGRLVQLVEPIMLVVMAVVIGTIMMSVMLPMMSLYQGMGNM